MQIEREVWKYVGRGAAVGLAVVAIGIGLAACGGTSADQPAHVDVSATARGLDTGGVDSVRAGLVEIGFANADGSAHALGIARLAAGVGVDDFIEALAVGDDGQAAMRLASFRGGVASLEPGRSWSVTQRLEAGNYALVDYAAEQPAVAELSVSGSVPPTSRLASRGSIEMTDFGFALDLPTRFSGSGPIEIENAGQQMHEITLVRLADGVSPTEGIEAVNRLAGGEAIEPPGTPVELLSIAPAGWRGIVETDLEPGRYIAVCLVPDEASGRPHSELGMATSFVVSRRGRRVR